MTVVESTANKASTLRDEAVDVGCSADDPITVKENF
jgi:hypothetical protein